MITVIAKRIDSGKPDGGQQNYARNLVNYMREPEKRAGHQARAHGVAEYISQPYEPVMRREKCIAVKCHGFSNLQMDAEEAALEMTQDCELSSRLKDGQGIDHWVMSFKATNKETINNSDIFKAVESWIDEMGYGEGHKWIAAIHADTDHIHVHIALNRVNYLTGLVKPHGFYKKDNQRALARVAYERGWSLEPGSKAKYKPKRKNCLTRMRMAP